MMEIRITEAAQQKLDVATDWFWRLAYDTEGCGCVVNGVPALWRVSAKEADDIEMASAIGPVLLDKTKAIFFDEQLIVDVAFDGQGFLLKSPNQILTPTLRVVEKRN